MSRESEKLHKVLSVSISPCTKNCSLNSSTNLCEGCGRTLDEIVEWTRMSDEEKQEVMSRLNGNQSMSSN